MTKTYYKAHVCQYKGNFKDRRPGEVGFDADLCTITNKQCYCCKINPQCDLDLYDDDTMKWEIYIKNPFTWNMINSPKNV